jgi:hypothetical protein
MSSHVILKSTPNSLQNLIDNYYEFLSKKYNKKNVLLFLKKCILMYKIIIIIWKNEIFNFFS